eukprot:gi/632968142/ref/XP_007900365.1/ PREDICTED: 1-phosphatidylinositol 4,5-bisphosphate phosphodiesterase eta-2 [Callorhinchus milii]
MALHEPDPGTKSLQEADLCPSAPPPCSHFLSANTIFIVERCMSAMQSGTQMVKLRGSSKGLLRFYYLDEHKSCIRWRPSRKNEKAKISIDAIREVCEGKQSEIFQRYSDGSFDPNCCFSIYYGDHMESLDLISSRGEESRTWITGLKYLMAGISDEDSLSKRQRTRDQWLKQTFTEADKNGDGSLSISEVLQLMHKLNVNLPRQKVKQMFKEADTDDNQGTLDFEEFCSFYKMMSTRRDLYLLMLMYSNHKDHLDTEDLQRFLEVEQKMTNVTREHCLEVIKKFEPCVENQQQGALGIDGFTSYMRSPVGDIYNPDHNRVNQDMRQPLCNYYIASSHNTYLMGDQLMSQSRVDMYAWVLQAGCRCVEVDCWDGPDGEPIVHHGYTLTSKILFRDVIETINKYAFAKTDYPVILSIENHCSVPQQKAMARHLCEVLGDKLDLTSVSTDDPSRLPSPESLRGKILIKGKKLPANISADAEEGDVSDEDSADEIEDECKLMNGDATANRKHVESFAKKKLDSLMKESKIRDREDPDSFSVNAIPQAGKSLSPSNSKKQKSSSGGGAASDKSTHRTEDGLGSGDDGGTNKRHSRSFIGSFSKRKKKTAKLKKSSSFEDNEDDHELQANAGKMPLHSTRSGRQKKTMKLSRALSDLVRYTKSVGTQDIETEVSCSWQVSSFSEAKTHQLLLQKPHHYLRFNQWQLSRIYPSSYRVDSSNFNPQPFWNAGCQLVALNYQSEGRVLQLNRAKFNTNGNCGYVLKPKFMTEGTFNPTAEEPLPTQSKKQLVLRIISGQQLPKPKDSMLGDRGEIIDPFVEVEVIGLAVDCVKEQTRVVDDNGFNPMWEETLVFTMHMPEIALVRFLVWDHDPIGRDFIGQRTLAFTSMMPGYRHVYLEGMEEASIFVHVAVNEISGKIKQVLGLKGLFHRNPKQSSLDGHVAVLLARKHSFNSHLLRRTASAPAKGQQKSKKGFPEIAIDTKGYSSEGASEDRGGEAEPERAGSAPECSGTAGTDGEALHDAEQCPAPGSPTPALETISEESTLPAEKPGAALGSRRTDGFSGENHCRSGEPGATHGATDSGCPEPAGNGDAILGAEGAEPAGEEAAGERVPEDLGKVGAGVRVGPDGLRRPADHPEETSAGCESPPAAPGGAAAVNGGDEAAVALAPAPVSEPRLSGGLGGTPSCQARRDVRSVPSRRRASMPNPAELYPSPVPAVVSDVTVNDRIWCKLEPGSHRDSMSSSSSMSSNDTVIDLSLPNLARKSLCDLQAACLRGGGGDGGGEALMDPGSRGQMHSRGVCKSKSNPNLRAEEGEGESRETSVSPPETPPSPSALPLALHPRRHTWNRLYVESLRPPASPSASPGPATGSKPQRAVQPARRVASAPSKSKSLGDLTSEDIGCSFQSKYKSISRSFVTGAMREQRRAAGGRGKAAAARDGDDLTERLRRLTSFEREDDITSPTARAGGPTPETEEPEDLSPVAMRRSSSRSQSRVRYVQTRARQAAEREQRLRCQSLGHASPLFLGLMEERGNPEGACSNSRSVCADLSLPMYT